MTACHSVSFFFSCVSWADQSSTACIEYRGKIRHSEARVMRLRIVALMCLILATVISLAAQNRVITNADLEKYRQAHLTAEREYRESYERLGMPSPAELDRRREQSLAETEKLSSKLRTEQLERERLDAQREQSSRSYHAYPQVVVQPRYYDPGYFGSYGTRYRNSVRPRVYQQSGYFAGGQFWPTGNRTPSKPAWRRR